MWQIDESSDKYIQKPFVFLDANVENMSVDEYD